VAPSGRLRGKGMCGVFAGENVWSIPERLRGEVLTTRRYTNLRLPLPLPASIECYILHVEYSLTNSNIQISVAHKVVCRVFTRQSTVSSKHFYFQYHTVRHVNSGVSSRPSYWDGRLYKKPESEPFKGELYSSTLKTVLFCSACWDMVMMSSLVTV